MASFGSFLTFITSIACDAASIGGGDDDYAAAADGRATVGNLGPQFNVVSYKKRGVLSTFCKVVCTIRIARLQNLDYLPWSSGYSLGIASVIVENLNQFLAAFLNYNRNISFKIC